jgi:hypothetical protein
MSDPTLRPAYYAARPGRLHDWWTLLHPPYTAWHLSYVVIGAALAPEIDAGRLLATLAAFFAAVGVGCHALDERHDRPLRTHISDRALTLAAILGIAVAVGLGAAGIAVAGWALLPFVLVGPFIAVAYNLEWFHGRFHTDLDFALAWGAFPLLTAYVAQTGRVAVAPIVAAVGAAAFSVAQRELSTPARRLRRKTRSVNGVATLTDGTTELLDVATLLAPLERALRALSWAVVALAAALAIARFT